ncbi:Rne/Rng family ribonuclease [Sandaracinobacter sp. RS1-74]|uniref:Rne/Rng family ribonuclease n=1 Tax=Sandaracinobacteroides sayramensis TaxID=2913411 RepID=UPI001EDA2150|nr:ribonuclease E/G [Sandaracinobacteroides sayramensis]MCG2840754.1 Rne/Rng family ribonuclease [Sandaracinobacteroides sayramensis]
MTTRMLIDARHQEETRVAVVKGSRIEEFDFEAAARKQIKGNIYLAKVTRVEPSLQAAFIDYGGNRHGFLAFSEIHPDYYQIPKEDREALLREEQRLVEEHGAADEEYEDGEDGFESGGDAHADSHGETGEEGEGRPRPEEHGNSEEAGAEALRRRRMALRRRYKIQEVIRRRQVMLVQVVKEERGNKGAALTTYISLAGRYSVLMPNTAQGGGISRKIANAADRKRLKTIMAELNLPSTMGAIVRTAGLERTKTEIKRDFDYLTRLWDEIRDKTLTSSAPALIYEDSDLVKRAIRDIYSREIDQVLVDGAEGYAHAKNFMKLLMPSHAKKVQLYNDPVPLFHRAGVETQLAQLLNPVVTLRSGGYIVMNPTEALVAIDVNSGRSTREYNIEETALKTNIEAAEEVARQLRLRDLAGLVVVDFIDMESNGNNRKVERALKDALKQDRARIQVGRISSFGLLEMSRQRLRTGVLEASTQVCPMCDGSGLVRTDGSAALAALRMLEEEAVKGRASHFRLRADSSVAVYMLNRKRAELAELEGRYGVIIEVVPDESLIGGRVVIDSSGPPPAQAPKLVALASPVALEADELDADEPEEDIEEEEDEAEERADGREERGGRDRRRRRRRRGGRDREGREPTEAREAGEEAEGVTEGVAEAGEPAELAEGGEAAEAGDREPRRKRRRRRRGGRRENGEAVQGEALAEGDEGAETGAGEGDEAPEAVVEAVESAAEVVETPAEPLAEAEAAPEKPRKRVSRAKKAPKAEAEAAVAVEGPVEGSVETAAEAPAEVAVEAEPAAEGKPAPKPRKRATRAKAPKAEEAAVAETADTPAEAAPESEAEAVEPAPKPKRARKPAASRAKAKAPVATEAEPVAEAAPVETPLVEAPVADAPVADASAADAPVTEPDAEPDGPPRRGWWQRTFGN